MAVTTLDLALAGMQPPKFFYKAITPTLVAGRPHSSWYLAGIPGPGAADTSTAFGVVRTAPVNGQIPFTNPGSGNSYLSRFQANATGAGVLLLCDRLWDCGANSSGSALSPTSTGAQTITSAAFPARDAGGNTNGVGVQIGVEVSTIMGAGTPTLTLAYTNSAGSSSRSGTNTFATVAASAVGAFYPIGLQAADVGVQSIQTLTANVTWTSGQYNLVAYRVLAALELIAAYTGNSIDLITGGFPQIYNGTVPFLIFIPNTTTASYLSGMMAVTQG